MSPRASVEPISRLLWVNGQTLLPKDLLWQEEALLSETAARFALVGPPFHGLAALSFTLEGNLFTVHRVAWVRPSGELVSAPGNATFAPPTAAASPGKVLDLSTAGSSLVRVFLHAARAPDVGEEGHPRTERRSVLRLATDSDAGGAEGDPLELIRFVIDDAGWLVDSRYAPPLLCLGRSVPFFRAELSALTRSLHDYRTGQLLPEVQGRRLTGDGLSGAKRALLAVYQLERLLGDLLEARGQPFEAEDELSLHPYRVYEELVRCHCELAVQRQGELAFERSIPRYAHREPAPSLGLLIRSLRDLCAFQPEAVSYHLFEADGPLQSARLPARYAEDALYFVVRKRDVGQRLDLSELKLGAPGRVATIRQHALRGVPFELVEHPPLGHGFGREHAFFHLDTSTEAWDHARREGRLAYYALSALDGLRTYLYWRSV